MGFLNKVKDSVSFLGNESLGDINPKLLKEKEVEAVKPKKEKKTKEAKPPKEKKIKEVKPPKEKKIKEVKPPKEKKIKKTFEQPVEEKPVPKVNFKSMENFEELENITTNISHKSYPILEMLGIPATYNASGVSHISEFEEAEFTRVAPVGIEISEVERFVDKTIEEIKRLHGIILERQSSFDKLLNEANAIQGKLIAKQHDDQLTSSILETKQKEDELKEKIVELQFENQELKHRLEQQMFKGPVVQNKKVNSLPEIDKSLRPTNSLPDLEPKKNSLPEL